MQPTKQEIDEVLNTCLDYEGKGRSIYPGMSYEQGVKAGIEWMLGEGEHPLDED